MNKQVHYIIYAHLILVALAGTLIFIKNIPFDIIDQQENTVGWCGTADMPSNVNLVGKAAQGKVLFNSKCAACHNLFKSGTGPALTGFEERGKWADRNELYKWIKNPAAYMKNDLYTRQLKVQYGSMMTGFSAISNEEIDAIFDYINQSGQMQY